MLFYNFSNECLRVLELAKDFAKNLGQPKIGSEHILLGIIKLEDSSAYRILKLLGIDFEEMESEIKRMIGHNWTNKTSTIEYSSKVEELFESAFEEASLDDTKIGSDHILYGMMAKNVGVAYELLRNHHVNINRIKTNIRKEKEVNLNIEKENAETPTLDSLAIDITKMAQNGEVDPLIGRDKETHDLIRILLRRKKNNPVLLGDPGVGKTALVEGLALNIIQGEVPQNLKNKKVLSLNLGTLVAGTRYRGEFEEKLDNIIEELKNSQKRIILFIDEIHTLVGAGGAEGSLDAANILKPSLARGEILCIGATTLEEYKQFIETDSALSRRFQPVMIDETTPEETFNILVGLKQKYEEFHQVKIPDSLLLKSIEYAEKYIPEKFFPDKVIDLIDEASSLTQISNNSIVSEKELKEVVSLKSGIPRRELEVKQKEDIDQLKLNILNEIKGQDIAIEKVTNTLKSTYSGINRENKPLASFLFYGPKETGKSSLAGVLSKSLYEDEKQYLYIDLNKIPFSQSRLEIIGNTNGYLGFEKRGHILNQVAKKPMSIIVFDNFDPDNSECSEVIDHLISNGEIDDIQERKISLKNTIFIVIYNTQNKGIGFNQGSDSVIEQNIEHLETLSSLDKNLLYNFDSLIPFKPLSNNDKFNILFANLEKLEKDLYDDGFIIDIEQKVLHEIIDNEETSNIDIDEIVGKLYTKIKTLVADNYLNGNLVKGIKYRIPSLSQGLIKLKEVEV